MFIVALCNWLRELFKEILTADNDIGKPPATGGVLGFCRFAFSNFQNNKSLKGPKWLIQDVLHHNTMCASQTRAEDRLTYIWFNMEKISTDQWCM